MRKVFLLLVAVVLIGMGLMHAVEGKMTQGIAFLAGGFAIILPALMKRGVGEWGDAQLLMGLVRNPAGTAYSAAVDYLLPDEKEEGRPQTANPFAASEPDAPAFDADAAFARYMERRDAAGDPVTSVLPPTDSQPVRTFGRKQV